MPDALALSRRKDEKFSTVSDNKLRDKAVSLSEAGKEFISMAQHR